MLVAMFGGYSNDGADGHKNAFRGGIAIVQVGGKSFKGTLTDKYGPAPVSLSILVSICPANHHINRGCSN